MKKIEVPPPGVKRVNVTMPLADFERLRRLAERRGEAHTSTALTLLRAALDAAEAKGCRPVKAIATLLLLFVATAVPAATNMFKIEGGRLRRAPAGYQQKLPGHVIFVASGEGVTLPVLCPEPDMDDICRRMSPGGAVRVSGFHVAVETTDGVFSMPVALSIFYRPSVFGGE